MGCNLKIANDQMQLLVIYTKIALPCQKHPPKSGVSGRIPGVSRLPAYSNQPAINTQIRSIRTTDLSIRTPKSGVSGPIPGLFPGVFQVRSFWAYTRSFRANLTKGQKHHACHGVQRRTRHSQCAGKEKGAGRGREGREGCGEAYPALDSCGGRPNDGARRVRRSFRLPTMEDVRGKPIRAEEWIKRAWGKVENEKRKMLVEGIDDPAVEGGDRWWDGGGMSPARERRREKEERAE